MPQKNLNYWKINGNEETEKGQKEKHSYPKGQDVGRYPDKD